MTINARLCACLLACRAVMSSRPRRLRRVLGDPAGARELSMRALAAAPADPSILTEVAADLCARARGNRVVCVGECVVAAACVGVAGGVWLWCVGGCGLANCRASGE